MTVYAIGNIEGRYSLLSALLAKIGFDQQQDTLWFAGNLVKPGRDSLAVLRFVKGLGKSAISVLGNLDLQLLYLAEGFESAEQDRSYADILTAPDRDELLAWLRQRPFLHHDAASNFALVHGGIPGDWSLSQSRTFAIEVESALSLGGHKAFLENTANKPPKRWHAKLRGWKRLNFIRHAFTCMTECDDTGYMDFDIETRTAKPDLEYMPWYRASNRNTTNLKILFAHRVAAETEFYPNIHPLNFGAGLTAMKLTAGLEKITIE